eukprot:CAMPEP_0178908648 /NCGR_PEP_ID=MMETSP0786-20121207/8040_1 /TAXON_ID=186022 /ORGANISM="Thalassionema frauenfeldii, Strain CCMP 1798" /LENGTH=591 /DNA_ID=CAMNT_0020580575 /DNA_START=211 /DNA_END=1983 /DNA_ORIENTATION=+
MKIQLIITLLAATQAHASNLRNRITSSLTCAGGADTTCHKYASCIDLNDTYECVCNSGYEGDGFRECNDIDECSSDNFPCPPPESGGFCVDTNVHDPNPEIAKFQGYKCGCDTRMGVVDGPVSNVHGPISCVDPLAPLPDPAPIDSSTIANIEVDPGDSPICVDGGQDSCHKFATCVPIDEDNFECVCNPGYEGDGVWSCSDVDECLFTGNDYPCPSTEMGGFCVDTDIHDPNPSTAALEGYMCGCDPRMGVTDGPVSDVHGPTTCVDINECLDPSLNDCDERAVCINFFGSYICECLEGFSGDGRTCDLFPSVSPSEAPSFASQCTGSNAELVIYEEAFSTGLAEGWTNDADVTTDFPVAFTSFLGPFTGNADPSRSFSIPTSVERLFVSFVFYEIDSWDEDSFGLTIDAPEEDISTPISFGTFNTDIEETFRSFSGENNDKDFSWKIESTPINDSPQGSLTNIQDQAHHVELELGPSLYSINGESSLTMTMNIDLNNETFIGFDNFRIVACVDTVPSAAPSVIPSMMPSMEPSRHPTRRPTRRPRPSNPQPVFAPVVVLVVSSTPGPTPATPGPTPDPTPGPTPDPTHP